jgi:hypothetical protein
MNYYEKYIKYKNKYLHYKKLIGGNNTYKFQNIEWTDIENNNDGTGIINYTGSFTGNVSTNKSKIDPYPTTTGTWIGKKYDDSIIANFENKSNPEKSIFENYKWTNIIMSDNGKTITSDIEPMKWIDKINNWENYIPQTYPSHIKERFFFKTSECDKHMQNIYREKFNVTIDFRTKTQDYGPYAKHIDEDKNSTVISFKSNSTSSDNTLIIPKPINGKNFLSIKDFIDNADPELQKNFWHKVAITIKELLKTTNKIYISTHGTGVYYFHLRLDSAPNYYSKNDKMDFNITS